MHLIIDAHQDLAWNMATFGRDYSKSAYETRQAEANTPIPEFNGDTMLGYPEFQDGKVAVVFGTLFASPARQEKHAWESQTYKDFGQADRLYRSQLDLYYQLSDTHPDKFKLIRKICKETHVDLCAINLKTREMRFCEIKRFELGCKPTEKFGDHQKLLLGFVRYAVDSLGEKAFVNRKYKVITDLIALVPKEDCSTFIPTKHEIKFAV